MWYLVRTKYGNEETAQINLERQGFETYKPLISLEKIRKGKLESIIEPAFRGYLFVSFDPFVRSASYINNTTGVTGLVMFGAVLRSIPNYIIDNIKKTFENAEHSDGFKAGESVHITDGPFSGLDAIFSEPDGEERSVIMLNLINKHILIKIDNKFIAR